MSCGDCLYAERGSYHPMHVGDDWRKWGTVKCIRTKKHRRVYALGGPGCDKYKPAKEVRS